MVMDRDHEPIHPYRRNRQTDRISKLEQSFHQPLDATYHVPITPADPPHPPRPLSDNVLSLSEKLGQQWLEYQHSQLSTNMVFDTLLHELTQYTEDCQQSFTQFFRAPENRPNFEAFPRAQSDIQRQIYSNIDADRSVGILNLLWHTISFTTRGNNRPMAIKKPGSNPVYTGRIVALLGDFQELTEDNLLQDFPELLNHEIASLFVPAHPEAPCMLRMSHLGDKDILIPNHEAPRAFIAQVVDTVCSGGFFHEKKSSHLF